jgi:hypothetical protein
VPSAERISNVDRILNIEPGADGTRCVPAALAARIASGSSRNASRIAGQRPLSEFQSDCRTSEQIQTSVRLGRFARM